MSFIKTSTTRYIMVSKQGYENQPAIITGKKEGDRIEVFCFMSRNPERFIWIERHELSKGEYTQLQLI